MVTLGLAYDIKERTNDC